MMPCSTSKRSLPFSALAAAPKVERTLSAPVVFRLPYSDQPEAERLVTRPGVEIVAREFGEDCIFTANVALDEFPAFNSLLSEKNWLTLKTN